MLRVLIAPNPSAMTLDGTRTYIIGTTRVAIIDPGPAIDSHLNAIVESVGNGVSASILLTHHHPDHDEAVGPLRERLERLGRLEPLEPLRIDAGELRSIPTPGHTPDHVSYWWPEQRAVFCGDLMMGGLTTALVAPPEGDLALYLESLEKLRELNASTIYPAHGPAFTEPDRAIDAYVRHRREREKQVLQALEGGPKDADQLTDLVYGDTVPTALRPYARAALDAYLHHLKAMGSIHERQSRWEQVR